MKSTILLFLIPFFLFILFCCFCSFVCLIYLFCFVLFLLFIFVFLIFQLLDISITQLSDKLFPDFGGYWVKVHITDFPIIEEIRNLRLSNVNKLVRVRGVVTRRTSVYPQLTDVVYRCQTCQHRLGPYPCTNGDLQAPKMCPTCQAKTTFTVDLDRSSRRNYQRMTVQESPSSVPAGRLPRSRVAILHDDLIDAAKPGQEVVLFIIFYHL